MNLTLNNTYSNNVTEIPDLGVGIQVYTIQVLGREQLFANSSSGNMDGQILIPLLGVPHPLFNTS